MSQSSLHWQYTLLYYMDYIIEYTITDYLCVCHTYCIEYYILYTFNLKFLMWLSWIICLFIPCTHSSTCMTLLLLIYYVWFNDIYIHSVMYYNKMNVITMFMYITYSIHTDDYSSAVKFIKQQHQLKSVELEMKHPGNNEVNM